MKKIIYIAALLNFGLKTVLSQDYHYAQFDANPLYINPALTGERNNKDYTGAQFNVNYREQTSRFTAGSKAYKSVVVGADLPINTRFSVGQYVSNNKSASGSFNTFQYMLSGSYQIIDAKIDYTKTQHRLAFGLQAGVINRTINPQNFTYDSQYSASSSDGFNRKLPSGENFSTQNSFNLGVNFGVYYRTNFKNQKLSTFGGFSLYDIAQQNISYIGMETIAPIRFNFHGGAIYKINNELKIAPQFLYMNQAKANEFNIGTLLYYKIKDTNYEPIIGLNWRAKNAIIMQVGLNIKGTSVRVSYCHVIKYLKEYRNSGLEISLVHALKKKQKENLKENPKEDTKEN